LTGVGDKLMIKTIRQTKVDIKAAQGCSSELLPAVSRVHIFTKTPRLLKPEYQHTRKVGEYAWLN